MQRTCRLSLRPERDPATIYPGDADRPPAQGADTGRYHLGVRTRISRVAVFPARAAAQGARVGDADRSQAQDGDVRLTVNWVISVEHRDYDRMPASVWIRCLQLLPYLEKLGVRCHVNAAPGHSDLTVFVRSQNAMALEAARECRERGQSVVLDLCVNYFDECSVDDGKYGALCEQADEVREMVKVADAVICASRNIAERAACFHDVVRYIPDSVDACHFRGTDDSHASEGEKRLRAIWCGIADKACDLDFLLPALKRCGVALTIVSNRDPMPRFSGQWVRWKSALSYRFVPWHHATFPQDIMGGDVCVSPRDTGTTYNLGHSFFKIGVFMHQGVPALASPVPSYEELIGKGNGGMICHTVDEWEAALLRLQSDSSLLRRWSREAGEIMTPYRTEKVARRYARLFEALASGDVDAD